MTQQSRGPHRNRHKADAEPEPGDELIGEWKRERLEAMDRRFRAAIKREFTAGPSKPEA
jgi:hypothetical protein